MHAVCMHVQGACGDLFVAEGATNCYLPPRVGILYLRLAPLLTLLVQLLQPLQAHTGSCRGVEELF